MKKILLFTCLFSIFGCKNTNDNNTTIYANETVLVVNYQLENMTLEEHAELGTAVAPSFTSENVPGLLGKSFIGNLESEIFGGIYYFSDKNDVDVYLESELWKGVVAHPNLVNFKTDVFRTFDGTEMANGNHSMRKTSSNPDDASDMHILVVNYTNEVNPSDEEMSSQVKEYAPVFSNENFPGMIGKTMINSVDGNIYGGVYYFTSRSAIDDYLASDLWIGFEGDVNTNVYKKDIYAVAPISSISNGVPIL
tara:strand:- start:2972 stop:3724 length:753 start_codon:yes stop_codon:yes gene_type:complete